MTEGVELPRPAHPRDRRRDHRAARRLRLAPALRAPARRAARGRGGLAGRRPQREGPLSRAAAAPLHRRDPRRRGPVHGRQARRRDERDRRASATASRGCSTRAPRSSSRCLQLDACSKDDTAVAYGVAVLTHESVHMRGVMDEAATECQAVSRSAGVAQALGASPQAAAFIADWQFSVADDNLPEQYQTTADCRGPAPRPEPIAPPGIANARRAGREGGFACVRRAGVAVRSGKDRQRTSMSVQCGTSPPGAATPSGVCGTRCRRGSGPAPTAARRRRWRRG